MLVSMGCAGKPKQKTAAPAENQEATSVQEEKANPYGIPMTQSMSDRERRREERRRGKMESVIYSR